MDINAQNFGGITTFDILVHSKDNAENRQLKATFIRTGARRNVQYVSPVASSLFMSWRFTPNPVELLNQNELVTCYNFASSAQVGTSTKSRSPSRPQSSEIIENGNYKPYYYSLTNSGQQKKCQTKRKVENLNQFCYSPLV